MAKKEKDRGNSVALARGEMNKEDCSPIIQYNATLRWAIQN